MISIEAHMLKKILTPKKLKLGQTKIVAHTLEKSTKQKSKLTTYTQKGKSYTQTQSDKTNRKP